MPTSARTSLIEAVDNGTSFQDGVAGSRNWLRLSHVGLAAYPGLGKQALSRMAAVCETTGLLTAALIEKGRRSQRQGR